MTNNKPSYRIQWQGGVRYGAPPPPGGHPAAATTEVPATVPTAAADQAFPDVPSPAEAAERTEAEYRRTLGPVVAAMVQELVASGGKAVLSPDVHRGAADYIAQVFVAKGWFATVKGANAFGAEGKFVVVVSSTCQHCHGSGVCGQRGEPCVCRPEVGAYPR